MKNCSRLEDQLQRELHLARGEFQRKGSRDNFRSVPGPAGRREQEYLAFVNDVASLSSGFARAMQDQADPRCNCVCAMVQRVSPWRTLYSVGAGGGATEDGTMICEPISRALASRSPGFSGSSSFQRRPSPSRDAANFQSVSPGLTVTIVSFPDLAGDGEPRGRGGVGSTRGARGAGTIARGAGTIVRGAATTGGAGKTRGRSKGDRLTNGRNGATTLGAD